MRLAWAEGDVAGTSAVYSPDDGEPIGFVEYHQRRRGDLLECIRVAHFRDGSSDEDSAVARVNGTLEAISGRSIIRGPDGEPIADVEIDVPAGHITGSWGVGKDRRSLDQRAHLSPATYWGPLIFIVLRNFDANREDGRVVFRTVVPTPSPRVLDMELVRGGSASLDRTGVRFDARQFVLRPTLHWTIDPLVHLLVPNATFWLLPGEPPALARFSGPRNYLRQRIVIQ